MRFFAITLLLGLALCLPFLFWGDRFTQWFTGDAALAWIRSWGAWGWLAVIALLVSDLFLPIPATPVMSAAGYLYGPWVGGLLSTAGSFLAGLTGYLLCRLFGQRLAVRLAGEQEMAAYRDRFARQGPWLVAASRWLPLLPEVITCLAGLTRMRGRIFLLSLACGTAPLGFAYAAIGAAGQQSPRAALAFSILLPPLLWFCVRPLFRRR